MTEITNEQKLYVLLKYKKNRTLYEKLQMLLIKFFNPSLTEWYCKAKQWCFDKDQILGDEPSNEQLEKYGGYREFHKEYPPYTHSSPIFLKELWKGAPSNPLCWWRNKKFLEVFAAVLTILGIVLPFLCKIATRLSRTITNLLF